jgi:hypothetical protein
MPETKTKSSWKKFFFGDNFGMFFNSWVVICFVIVHIPSLRSIGNYPGLYKIPFLAFVFFSFYLDIVLLKRSKQIARCIKNRFPIIKMGYYNALTIFYLFYTNLFIIFNFFVLINNNEMPDNRALVLALLTYNITNIIIYIFYRRYFKNLQKYNQSLNTEVSNRF